MQPQTIESLEDPRVALYRGLRDPELQRRGFFIVEGRTNVRCLIEASHASSSRFATDSVFLTPAGLAGLDSALAKLPPETPVYLASQSVLNSVVGFNIHRGVVAAAECRHPARLADLPAKGRLQLLVALEGVSDPDNVGSIFRSAAAFGAGGVLLCPRSCDPLYRKAVRVSMGAALQLPFVRCDSWPDALLRLRALGYRIVALHPGAESSEIGEYAARQGADDRLVLVLGSEGSGLSDPLLALADAHVRIGMEPGVDSINVGTAAGIALHQLTRPWARVPPS